MTFAYWELAANFVLGIVWPLVILVLGLRFGKRFLKIIRKFFKENEVEEVAVAGARVKARKKAERNYEQLFEALEERFGSAKEVPNSDWEIYDARARELGTEMASHGPSLRTLEYALEMSVKTFNELSKKEGFVLEGPLPRDFALEDEGETYENHDQYLKMSDTLGGVYSLIGLLNGILDDSFEADGSLSEPEEHSMNVVARAISTTQKHLNEIAIDMLRGET